MADFKMCRTRAIFGVGAMCFITTYVFMVTVSRYGGTNLFSPGSASPERNIGYKFMTIANVTSMLRLTDAWDNASSTDNYSSDSPKNINNTTKKKYHVTAQFRGRLGNILFQYAAIMGMAQKNNMDVILPTNYAYKGFFPAKDLSKVFTVTKRQIISRDLIQNEYLSVKELHVKPGYYNNMTSCFPCLLGKEGNVLVKGFFQSFKYFVDIAENVRQELQPTQIIQHKVHDFVQTSLNKNTRLNASLIGIHIRRLGVTPVHSFNP